MLKTIKDFNLENKKVIIRVDFNVPIENGIITDDTRIKEAIKTITYALSKKAKVILLSHLGRIKTEADLQSNTLKPVSKHLSELLKKPVLFIPTTRGPKLTKAIDNMQAGDIILIENTRYEDLIGEKESKNDPSLGAYWASLGDIFINDAFGTAHRAHASNVGISSHLPNGVGFLMEKEVTILSNIINKPQHPFTVILGGAKVSDKIGVIENLVKIADYILIGGAMSYTFLKAEGYNVGKSLVDNEYLDFCKKIIKNNKHKIVLPVDTITSCDLSPNAQVNTRLINEIRSDEMGLDIGPITITIFENYLIKSNTVFLNGPVGMFELKNYAHGTEKILDILSTIKAQTIIGGGDTASAANNMGYAGKFTHISTGGGASLEMLASNDLPGLMSIDEK